jgi:hypothetical protein
MDSGILGNVVCDRYNLRKLLRLLMSGNEVMGLPETSNISSADNFAIELGRLDNLFPSMMSFVSLVRFDISSGIVVISLLDRIISSTCKH